ENLSAPMQYRTKRATQRFDRHRRVRSVSAKALSGLGDRRLPDPGAVNSESSDAPSIHRHDFHFSARDRNAIAHARQATKLGESVSAESGPVAFRDLNAVVGTHID